MSFYKECPVKGYAIDLSAWGEDFGCFPDNERMKNIKCISNNHIDCFKMYKDEFNTDERKQIVIRQALRSGNVSFLEHMNVEYGLTNYISSIEPFSLSVIRYLREELKIEWSDDFITKCKDYEVLKYALQNGCKCVDWKLKMILHNFREKMENDEWMKDLYEKLEFH